MTPWLDAAKEWSGQWWLPGHEAATTPGTLKYDPTKGIELYLIGTVADGNGREPSTYGFGDTLLFGEVEGAKVTLIGGILNGPTKYGSGLQWFRQTVPVETALIGAHIGNPDDAVFQACLVGIENVLPWANTEPIKVTHKFTDDWYLEHGQLTMEPVGPLKATLETGTTVSLENSYRMPTVTHQRGSEVGTLGVEPYLHFIPKELWSLSDAFSHARVIQDLISLATSNTSALLWMQLLPENKRTQSTSELEWINVYELRSPKGRRTEVQEFKNTPLFTCADRPFDEIVPAWFSLREQHQAACNIVLGLSYTPERYVESAVLLAVSAAESLHKTLGVKKRKAPKGETRKKRQEILDMLPHDLRPWVKVSSPDGPSLKNRLLDLAKRLRG